MMRATFETSSQGIYEQIPTEDIVGYIQRESSILAWAIDGASTLTANPFTTFHGVTNAGWFARRLDRRLREACRDIRFSKALLGGILQDLKKEYGHAGGFCQPLWAWPSAAGLFVEISRMDRLIQVSIFRYADCFAEIFQDFDLRAQSDADAPPWAMAFDTWKPFSGFRGQKLADLWRRRAQQQMNVLRNALTINPASAMNAVEAQHIVLSPAHILVGSDGLSRLWDTYRVMTKEEAMRVLVQRGLPALLWKLREFEATSTTGNLDLKRRDDASGLHVFLA